MDEQEIRDTVKRIREALKESPDLLKHLSPASQTVSKLILENSN
jgi:hypothetical protein